jgi:hypothetical protein
MLIRRQTRAGRILPWDNGHSLPVGYAAISFIAPRRRRGIGWAWAVGGMLTVAAGAVAWALR